MRIRKSALLCAMLCLCILLAGCGSTYKQIPPDDEDITPIGTVGGKQVYLDELRFAAQVCRAQLTAAYGEDIFSGDDAQVYRDMLIDAVKSGICANYALLLLCEESYISLGEEAIVSRVDQKLQSLVDELGGMREYKKYLSENGLTDRLLRFSTELSLLQSELMYVYIDDILLIENDDTEVFEIIEQQFIVTRHIFVPHSESDTMQLVTAALERGEDFSTLLSQYNRDSEMTSTGQFILRGYMSDQYDAAAFELDVGERSGIVSDSNGLFIIERLEMSTPAIMMNFDYLKELYQAYAFYDIVDQKQSELTLELNDAAIEYLDGIFQ